MRLYPNTQRPSPTPAESRHTNPRPHNHLYTDEEALLPLLWLHPRPLQDRIRAGNADPLRGGRTLQVQHVRLSELLSCGLQRITDGEEDGTTHEEWRFAWLMLAIA